MSARDGSDDDVSLEDDVCPVCYGEGGYHDCGEDTCCCANPDDDLIACEECGGEGRIFWHSKDCSCVLCVKRRATIDGGR